MEWLLVLLVALSLAAEECDETVDVCTPSGGFMKVPHITPALRAVLHGNHRFFDPGFDKMELLLAKDGFQEFSHSQDVFTHHLKGTFATLGAWGQPQEVLRLGLFHSAYSGDLFIFHYFCDSHSEDRAELREHIGEEAERLVHLFGTTKRDIANDTAYEGNGMLPNSDLMIKNRNGLEYGTVRATAKDIAKVMLVSMADVFDQMLQVNAWRNVYQHDMPTDLYPGQVRPDVQMHWMSRVCMGIRHELDVVPAIFSHCTEELTYANEVKARDAYWHVILHEAELETKDREKFLRAAIGFNPHIAEPHVLLSQVLFQSGRFEEAAKEAAAALDIFYVWANSWDKRLPFRQWVGFTRVLLLRCQRVAQGLSVLPFNPEQKSNVRAGMARFGGLDRDLHTVSIKDMLKDM